MTDCIFCRIVAGQMGSILYQDDEVAAFRDIKPQAEVHILIVPRKHIAGVADITEKQAKLLGHMAVVANRLAKQEGISESGYRLVINNGPDAGQAVPHLHLHLLGGRPMGWPPG